MRTLPVIAPGLLFVLTGGAMAQRPVPPPPVPQLSAATAAAPARPPFPATVAPKYAKEPVSRARMHTCLDQYHANKATHANNGMKWIQKGGGYYPACLKHLKNPSSA